tara:strand:- start:28089 stop:28679 length:591 start_codon:yes stop_codon:yes gene_type:complete
MEYTHLLALLSFAIAGSFTPGPNNIMLMTSGANVGFYRTIPHILGIIGGYSLMLLLVGLGLMQFLQQYPLLQKLLQILCIIYLLYLAYKIATSKVSNQEQTQFRPMSLFAAAGFQWFNPKGWSMALSAITIYSSDIDDVTAIIMITAVFAVVNIPSACIWTLAGKKCQNLLANPQRLKIFNYSMASLLVLSVGFSL